MKLPECFSHSCGQSSNQNNLLKGSMSQDRVATKVHSQLQQQKGVLRHRKVDNQGSTYICPYSHCHKQSFFFLLLRVNCLTKRVALTLVRWILLLRTPNGPENSHSFSLMISLLHPLARVFLFCELKTQIIHTPQLEGPDTRSLSIGFWERQCIDPLLLLSLCS